ncbi:hypothetical protein [Frankia sp. QA3]|uniref:hypothetical protein n=1 Tax=Frankia sp. QA3 TaxID=710111 RepID=UPI0012FBDE36|nr:hypothetical protein [Frankia sp. QA3]
MDDPHVRRVVDFAPRRRALTVFDAASIQRLSYRVSGAMIQVESVGGQGLVDLGSAHRGWIRRPLPPAWNHGVVTGSKQSAINSGWQSLVAFLARNPRCSWLTGFDALLSAENKLTQGVAASSLGIEAPRTFVGDVLDGDLPDVELVVAKPLGMELFWLDRSRSLKVFASAIDPRDPVIRAHLSGSPFLLQTKLTARRHLRVVTVADRSWAFELDAVGLPLDWRIDPSAHHSWKFTRATAIERQALQIAAAMSVRFSSQDWIENDDGAFFIDLNPGGQWLFLPEPHTAEVAAQIASWLSGDTHLT